MTHVEYDEEADCWYVVVCEGALPPGAVVRTKQVHPRVNLDLDVDGNLVGMEVL